VCGTDVSPRGLALTREWLRREGLDADLKISDMTVIPYPDEYFDGLISTYVIHHNTLDNIGRCVAEIYRVLAPGGKALLIVQSKRGYRYRCGQEIEPDTMILDVGADAGVPHHFFDKAALRELLPAFDILSITAREHTDPQGHRHAHWKASVEKPQLGQAAGGAAAVALTLWLTPHAMIYDWSLLLIPAVLLWQELPGLRARWPLLFAAVWLATLVGSSLSAVQLRALPIAVQVSVPVLGAVLFYT